MNELRTRLVTAGSQRRAAPPALELNPASEIAQADARDRSRRLEAGLACFAREGSAQPSMTLTAALTNKQQPGDLSRQLLGLGLGIACLAIISVLSGVSCTTASACTAVGYYVNSAGTRLTLAERWNGTSWATQTTPNPTS
ncbi:MAG: hypothetical protein QOI03_1265, partial [Solirubrobacteraceae bacterium]|nr:hypothetical protein [Solirubrobacteraceae bacterium]